MRLGIYNVWTVVEEASQDELAWLRHTLSVRVKKARGQEGTETFLQEHTKPFPLFPTGWLRSVQHFAKSQEGAPETTITDHRVKPCVPLKLDLAWLYPYQAEAVQVALQRSRGLIQLPTGAGKSELMTAVIISIPCPCLIIIRDRSLLSQLAATYHRRSGKVAGIIGDGRWSEGYVTVAMVQSVDSYWDRTTKKFAKPVEQFLQKFGMVIADEAHGVASQTAMRILESMHNAYYRIGFSATMTGRSDMRDGHIISNFGRIIHQRSDTEIEELGKIATAEIRIHRVNQPGIPGYADGGYTMGISRSQSRNHAVARIWQKAAKPCLTYVREIEHGRVLLDMAEKMGYKATFIHGEIPEVERRAALAQMEAHGTDILIGSDALRQGVDMVHIRELINAAGGKSLISTVQRKGRGGRICHKERCAVCDRYGKKTSLIVHDFYDTANVDAELLIPGLTTKKKHWLEEHSKKRMKTYQERGYSLAYT